MKKKARKELLKLLNDNCLTCDHRTKSASYCEKNCKIFKNIRHYGAIIWSDKVVEKENKKPFKSGKWTRKELDYLKVNYGKKSTKQMITDLNRPKSSINGKIHYLRERGELKKKRRLKEYAVYRGGDLVCMGTAVECAEVLDVSVKYISWLTTNSAKRRADQARNPEQSTVAVVLDD